jgi:hypothetical protein
MFEMNKKLTLLLVVALLTFALASQALAAGNMSDPIGSCPNRFEIMAFMDHADHPYHIGVTVDLNGDGWICMRHLSPTLHLHVDNSIPLR